ncbi:MAG: rod shape-determining protein MreC [Candidatus Sumerlaeia bacterium]|nr:rod shape-determining protein MreC [Candidatus Sumerlaeia bacterium]
MHVSARRTQAPRHAALAVAGVLACAGVLALVPTFSAAPGAAAGWSAGTLLSPVWEAGAGLHRASERLWRRAFGAAALEEENAALRRALTELQVAQALGAAEGQAAGARLGAAALTEPLGESIETAVLGPAPNAGRRLLAVNAGSLAGVAQGMLVLGPGGVAGRVDRVFPSACLVELLADRESRWGAVAEQSGDVGLLRGVSRDGFAEVEFDSMTVSAAPGERLLTTGRLGSGLVAGLPLGTIVRVSQGPSGTMVAEVELAEPGTGSPLLYVVPAPKLDWQVPQR